MKRILWLTLGTVVGLVVEARAQQQQQKAPRPPYTPPASVIMEADVEYGRGGESSLKLDLMRPRDQGDQVLPVIAMIHGGGWSGGRKEDGRPGLAAYVATGNYVGVTIEYRLTGEVIWPAQIHDCKAAIRWLRAHAGKYYIDPDRIGVFGSSAGGHLVALLGTSGDVPELEGECGNPGYSSRVQCVVDYCGPSDFPHFLDGKEVGGRAAVTKFLGGPPAERAVVARAASPVTWVSKDDPPFLIAHGTADATVPFAQGESLAAALRQAGVPVIFVRIEGGGHRVAAAGKEILQRQRLFFDRYLRHQTVEISAAPIAVTEPPKKSP